MPSHDPFAANHDLGHQTAPLHQRLDLNGVSPVSLGEPALAIGGSIANDADRKQR